MRGILGIGFMFVFIVLVLSCGIRDSGTAETGQMREETVINQLAQCIRDFLTANADRRELTDLGVMPSSVDGRRIEEKPGLFFIGDWSAQQTDKGYRAIWTKHIGDKAAVRLVLELKAEKDKFTVEKWYVEELDRNRQ